MTPTSSPPHPRRDAPQGPGRGSPMRAALWVAAIAGASEVAQNVFHTTPLASSLVSLGAVLLAVERAGLGWSQGDDALARRPASVDPPASRLAPANSMALGVGFAALACVVTIAVSAFARALRFAPSGFDAIGLALGALRCGFEGVRDTLALRWAPFCYAARVAPRPAALFFAALLGAAPVVGSSAPSAIFVALASGALGVALIARTGTAYAAVGADVALRVIVMLVTVGPFGARWSGGALAPLRGASGLGAWVLGATLFAVAALVGALHRRDE